MALNTVVFFSPTLLPPSHPLHSKHTFFSSIDFFLSAALSIGDSWSSILVLSESHIHMILKQPYPNERLCTYLDILRTWFYSISRLSLLTAIIFLSVCLCLTVLSTYLPTYLSIWISVQELVQNYVAP